MAKWSEETRLFKSGIIGLFISFVVFSVGFFAPLWMYVPHHDRYYRWERDHDDHDSGSHESHESHERYEHEWRRHGHRYGLWRHRSEDIEGEHGKGWMCAVKILEIISFVSFTVAVILTLIILIKKNTDFPKMRRRVMPSFQIVAGIFGLIGLIVFAKMAHGNPCKYGWSFYLVCGGSIIAIVCGILIAVSPFPERKTPPKDTFSTPVVSVENGMRIENPYFVKVPLPPIATSEETKEPLP